MHIVRPKIIFFSITALFIATLFFSFSQQSLAFTDDGKPVEVISSGTFELTVDKVKKLIAKNDMMVMGEINQGKMLSMTGLKLNGVTLFIGNPVVGKKVFSEEPSAGLAIPIRLYIYETAEGNTVISYYRPSVLLTQYHNNNVSMIGKMLDGKLEMLTTMASK